ncbi:MAG: hypothetical protein JWR63_2097 [Conexibacter sp.]|nr:hypothetical protein [Conexibacter sp.]
MAGIHHRVSFLESAEGTVVVVVHANPQDLADAEAAARACRLLSMALGGLPVVQRCAAGNGVLFGGPPHLRRHAADFTVDALPVVEITVRPSVAAAA